MGKAQENETLMRRANMEVVKHFGYTFNVCCIGSFKEPGAYFLAYVFETDEELEEARNSGLLDEITEYHRQSILSSGYPTKGIRAPRFTSEEHVDKVWNGEFLDYFARET